MRELTLIILLITPSTRVLMTVGFRYAEEDQTQLSNALVLIVTVLTLIGELLMRGARSARYAVSATNTPRMTMWFDMKRGLLVKCRAG